MHVGFSFGGMLACCVAANLWEETYVNIDTLQKNVICITFGQPMINIPFVQEAIKHFPQLRNTIHLIYDKEDIFPLVFRYFSIGCIHYKGQGVPVKGVKALTAGTSMVFEPPLIKEVRYNFCKYSTSHVLMIIFIGFSSCISKEVSQ